ncbi:MAG: ADP-ribosylglycohydrolase family protein [Microscillaceae bacterium]|nr:ADP-ribosylglycohydrolase family protein [Microscillaceae bacterium]
MNPELIDQIKGLIFGQAIGDALGLGTELMTKKQVDYHYPQGLIDYHQIIQDKHRSRWKRGEWTDDTDQMLCIVESLLATKTVNSYNIATRIYDWAFQGGRGLGQTAYEVLTHPAFLSNPSAVAKEVWLKSNKNGAANGGIMRTAILGIWQYKDANMIKYNAEKVCKITHYDPRCVGSCVVVSLAVSELLKGNKNIDRLLSYLSEEADAYDARIREYISPQKYSNFFVNALGHLVHQESEIPKLSSDITDLKLSEPDSLGYTLKAMGSGLWALAYAESYEDGISQIIHEGGDADTNASVAGALLGTKFGFSSIPKPWVSGLLRREYLEEKVQKLIQVIDKQSVK